MERAKELTGDDFDPLFEDLSDESANLALELMHESYNSFNLYIQRQWKLNLQSNNTERDLINGQHCGTTEYTHINKSHVVGSTVLAYAGCPPPRLASAAAFDDTVISLLGDSGGADEVFWNSLQDINLENSSLRVTSNSRVGGAGQFISVADADSHGQSQGTDAADDTKLGTDAGSTDPHNQAVEDPVELIQRYGKSLVEVLRGETSKAFSAAPPLPAQQHAHNSQQRLAEAPAKTIDVCSSSKLAELVDSIQKIRSNNASTTNITSVPAVAEAVSVRLGKRGRYFLDIWDEEEYIARIKGPTRLRPLYQWEDLFQAGYSDNHDGCYRDWLLSHQETAKARLNDPKFKKNKRRSSDPIFRYDLGVGVAENSGLSTLAAPPVPVAIQHPASWAVRSTESANVSVSKSDQKKTIDVSLMHPASVTSTLIQPTHQKQSRSAQAAAAAVSQSSSSSSSSALNSTVSAMDVEDVDDFNIYADRLLQSLQAQEVTNFARLARLQSAIRVHSNPQLRALQDKRRKLEDLMSAAAQSMEPTSADRVVYAFKPTKLAPMAAQAAVLGRIHGDELTGRSADILRLDIHGNVVPRKMPMDVVSNSQSRYNTRCTESSANGTVTSSKPDAIKLRRDLVGGSSVRQVAHGATLAQCLVPEAEVEVCLKRQWQVATVCRVMYDGEHIRHVKVTPQDCTALESVWVSVEDGKLAPYGTHLRPISVPAASTSISNSNSAATTAGKTQSVALSVTSQFVNSDEFKKSEASSTAMDVQQDVVKPTTQENKHVNKEAVALPATHMTAVVSRETSGAALLVPENQTSIATKTQGANGWRNETRMDASVPPPPQRQPSISRPVAPVAIQPQQPQLFQKLSPSAVVPGIDSFKQSPGMLGLVSDPRLRRGQASLQDYHGPSHAHAGMLSMAPGLNIPIHAASFGYAGNVAMDTANGAMNGTRIKIPLPMGATDKRDLIAAVHPFTPLSYVPAMAPQPFNPYTRHRFGNGQQVGLQGQELVGAPYQYEYEGAGEVHHRPAFDAVSYRAGNGDVDNHSSTGTSHSEEEPRSNGHEYVMLPPASTAAATGANTTFRLGKKGAITRN